MAKVTSKLQVTIPKAVADQVGIKPGDHLEWTVAGDIVRVLPARRAGKPLPVEVRLKLFDKATARVRARDRKGSRRKPATERGWTREGLYERGRAR